jgi:hypothetical protein
MPNTIPTPNLNLKRRLKKDFKLILFDEFRTSCLHNITEERCKNLKIKKTENNKGFTYYIYSILSYKTSNNKIGYINRDDNAVKNMKKIISYQLKYGERPRRYDRRTDLNKENTNIEKIQEEKIIDNLIEKLRKIKDKIKKLQKNHNNVSNPLGS